MCGLGEGWRRRNDVEGPSAMPELFLMNQKVEREGSEVKAEPPDAGDESGGERSRLTAIVPAAGLATRLGGRDKMLLEVDGAPMLQRVLERIAAAGVDRCIVVTRDQVESLPALPAGKMGLRGGLEVVHRRTAPTPSAVHTAVWNVPASDRQRPGLLVFPDLWVRPANLLTRVVERFHRTEAELVLGCVPSDRPDKADMVRFEADRRDRSRGRLLDLAIKDPACALEHTWTYAAWRAGFWRRLESAVAAWEVGCEASAGSGRGREELYYGTVLRAALRDGVLAEVLVDAEGRALDVGTPDDLERARREAGP